MTNWMTKEAAMGSYGQMNSYSVGSSPRKSLLGFADSCKQWFGAHAAGGAHGQRKWKNVSLKPSSRQKMSDPNGFCAGLIDNWTFDFQMDCLCHINSPVYERGKNDHIMEKNNCNQFISLCSWREMLIVTSNRLQRQYQAKEQNNCKNKRTTITYHIKIIKICMNILLAS